MKYYLSIIFIILASFTMNAEIVSDSTKKFSNSERHKCLAVGYRLGLITGNVQSKGIFSNFSFNPVIGNSSLSSYRMSFDLKILGLEFQKMTVSRSFYQVLSDNKKNLYGTDSLYQASFFNTLDSAGKNTGGNIFISMSILKPITQVGNNLLYIGLGLGTRSIKSSVSTKFAQDVNGEPANFWLNFGRVYMAHISLEPFYGIKSSKKVYWKSVFSRLHFTLSAEYIDYNSMKFAKYNVSRKFTTTDLSWENRVNMYFSFAFTLLS